MNFENFCSEYLLTWKFRRGSPKANFCFVSWSEAKRFFVPQKKPFDKLDMMCKKNEGIIRVWLKQSSVSVIFFELGRGGANFNVKRHSLPITAHHL